MDYQLQTERASALYDPETQIVQVAYRGVLDADTSFELSGDVYVSGDLVITAPTVVQSNTTFWIAVDDIYEDDIEVNDNAPDAFMFDRSTDIAAEPTNRLSPNGVCIYVETGGSLTFGSNVTFRSWAVTPGDADWEGIQVNGGALVGTPTVLNAAN